LIGAFCALAVILYGVPRHWPARPAVVGPTRPVLPAPIYPSDPDASGDLRLTPELGPAAPRP
jgi:hypothetical protein